MLAILAIVFIAAVVFIYIKSTLKNSPYANKNTQEKTAESMVEDDINSASLLAHSPTSIWLKIVGIAITPFMPIFGGISYLFSKVFFKNKLNRAMKEKIMEDEWFEKVSASSSEKGRQHLAKLLLKQGHITLEQAAEWKKIEEKEKGIEINLTQAQQAIIDSIKK